MSASDSSGASQVTRSVRQHGPGLVVYVRILEVGVGERRGDLAVELGVGLDVDRGAAVQALEIEDATVAISAISPISSSSQSFSGSSLNRRSGISPGGGRLGRGLAAVLAEPREPGRTHEAQRRESRSTTFHSASRPGAGPGRAPRTRKPNAGSGARCPGPGQPRGTGRARRRARKARRASRGRSGRAQARRRGGRCGRARRRRRPRRSPPRRRP